LIHSGEVALVGVAVDLIEYLTMYFGEASFWVHARTDEDASLDAEAGELGAALET
jgi:hypothetical protein